MSVYFVFVIFFLNLIVDETDRVTECPPNFPGSHLFFKKNFIVISKTTLDKLFEKLIIIWVRKIFKKYICFDNYYNEEKIGIYKVCMY